MPQTGLHQLQRGVSSKYQIKQLKTEPKKKMMAAIDYKPNEEAKIIAFKQNKDRKNFIIFCSSR